MPKFRTLRTLLLVVLVCSSGKVSWASDLAAAEALFNDGRKLMQEGQTELACSKFEESGRLDPSPGTSLNLARCYEKLGRTASAWAQYQVAERLARAQNRNSVAKEAAKKAAELGATLGTVSVVVSEPVPGLAVQLGDVQLESGALGSKIPFDPGTYTLRVTAPDHRAHEAEVNVKDGENTDVTVPKLEPEPEPVAAPPVEEVKPIPPPVETEPAREQGDSTLAYWVGGGGIVLLGGGVVLGALAGSESEEAKRRCGGGTTDCPPDAMGPADSADTLATVGTVVGTVGVVAIGVGAVMLFTSGPSEPQDSALLDWSISIGSDSAGLVYSGAFE